VGKLTVLTWNLQGRRPRGVGLPAVLARYEPDIAFLQEADFGALETEASLAAWTASAYADAGAGSRPGMAILSRLPLLRASTLVPTPTAWDRPRALEATIGLSDGELMAVCVHAKAPMPIPFLHAEPRNRQLADLKAWLAERTGDKPVIVAGDFNSVSLDIPGLTDVGTALARPGPTWRPFGVPWFPPMLRLDRVFVSTTFTPVEVTVPCRASRSDHCPVIAQLELGLLAKDARRGQPA
jgi:endonuclease/exonuclease/phosphatase family metal-dependent hydrolase